MWRFSLLLALLLLASPTALAQEPEPSAPSAESPDSEPTQEDGDANEMEAEPPEPEPEIPPPAPVAEPAAPLPPAVAVPPAAAQPEDRAAPPDADADADATAEGEAEPPSNWNVSLHGEFRFRFEAMSDVPLHTEPRTEFPANLGQNWWTTSWLRLTGEVSFKRQLRLIGQIDVADGMLFGEETQGVDAAARPRNGSTAFAREGIDPRWLYLEYLNPRVGMVRAGLQPSHWGLGILANDGTHEPPFGDYRYGNSNIRILFGTRPLGMQTPLNLVVAGDLVYRDPLAQLTDGERALQAVLALYYGDPADDTVGAYVVRRSEIRRPEPGAPNDELDVWVLDLFARTQFDDPTGKGEIILAFEGIHLRGDTTYTRTVDRPSFDIRQWMWAFQAGRTSEIFDVFLEAGYTSGDSNTEDSVQRRATMHPDHRVGLILFPEVMAWHTARASTLASSNEFVGRPPPGSDLLPTDGGVSGATYLFNWWTVRPLPWMKLNVGWLWARASADIVDPYRQRSQSRSVGFLGGDSSNRDLGFEVDASFMMHKDLPFGVRLQGGVEGGVLFPGHAFDDATGFGMNTVGMVRARLALIF